MLAVSDEVRHVLTQAGWYPGRTTDTTPYRHAAAQLQLPWLPAAETLLREYGGLWCYFTRHDQSLAQVAFDVAAGAAVVNLDRVRHDFAARIPGRQLTIVGRAYADPLCLFAGADGAFYGACQEGLYRLAATASAAIEAIVLDLPFEPL